MLFKKGEIMSKNKKQQDSFIVLCNDYIKDLKKIKNRRFFKNKLYVKDIFFSYFDFEEMIDNYINEIYFYKKRFKKKSIDSNKTFEKLFSSFYQIDIDINDQLELSEEKFPISWLKIRHKRFLCLAKKCIDSTVYEESTKMNNIKIIFK